MNFKQAQPVDDGKVDGYTRVVNGKVVQVNAYGKKGTSTTTALKKSRRLPGRPQMAANPGSYTSGRDIPGVGAVRKPVAPKPVLPAERSGRDVANDEQQRRG